MKKLTVGALALAFALTACDIPSEEYEPVEVESPEDVENPGGDPDNKGGKNKKDK